jgi:hypothetical protein
MLRLIQGIVLVDSFNDVIGVYPDTQMALGDMQEGDLAIPSPMLVDANGTVPHWGWEEGVLLLLN